MKLRFSNILDLIMSYLKRDFMKAVARVTLATALIAGITYPSLSPADKPPPAPQQSAASAATADTTQKPETYVVNGQTMVIPPYVAPPSEEERQKFGPAQQVSFTRIAAADAGKVATQYPMTDAVNKLKELHENLGEDAQDNIQLGKVRDTATNTDVLIVSYSGLQLCTGVGCPTDVYVKDSAKPDSEYKFALHTDMVLPVSIRSKKGGTLVLDPSSGPDNPTVPFYYYHPETHTFLNPADEAVLQRKTNPNYAPPPGDPESVPFDTPDSTATPAPDTGSTPAPKATAPVVKPPKP